MPQNSSKDKQRLRQRFDVNLKTIVSPETQKTQEHQCRITNLSATGACLHFKTPATFPVGMQVSLKIFISSTIIQLTNSGEIMWIKQQPNECSIGIKFENFLSETMMTQLLKKN